MGIAPEGVGLLFAEIGFDAADGELHQGEASAGRVALLTLDSDIASLPPWFLEWCQVSDGPVLTEMAYSASSFIRRRPIIQNLDSKSPESSPSDQKRHLTLLRGIGLTSMSCAFFSAIRALILLPIRL